MNNFRLLINGGEGRLSFVKSAKMAFAFLLRRGFSISKVKSTFVRFESNVTFVNVYHGRLSYHVDVEIGRLAEGDIYSLYEVLSVVAPAEVARSKYQTTDSGILAECLGNIADILDHFCWPLLSNDQLAFDALKTGVRSIRETATLKAQFGATIDKADRAWETKDLRQALSLYEKAEVGLDRARRERLQYLRRRSL